MFRKVSTKSFGLALVILVLGAAIYGFAAANTVPDTSAGDGAGTICGYTISNIDYTLNGTDPGILDEVSFDATIDPACSGVAAPNTVQVRLDASTSTWYSCGTGATHDYDCDLTGTTINVIDADELRVIIVE